MSIGFKYQQSRGGYFVRFFLRLVSTVVALFAALGLSAVAAQAQPTVQRVGAVSLQQGAQFAAKTGLSAARACTENFWYISGNGVRIRATPGGKIEGSANYWERVDRWQVSGVWVRVYFKNRPLYIHPRSGWVHQDYVSFHQPTCW